MRGCNGHYEAPHRLLYHCEVRDEASAPPDRTHAIVHITDRLRVRLVHDCLVPRRIRPQPSFLVEKPCYVRFLVEQCELLGRQLQSMLGAHLEVTLQEMVVAPACRVLVVHHTRETRVVVEHHFDAFTQQPRRVQDLCHTHVEKGRRRFATYRGPQVLLGAERRGKAKQNIHLLFGCRCICQKPFVKSASQKYLLGPFHPTLLLIGIIGLEPVAESLR